GNKRRKQELFCFVPEGITAFSLAAGVGHEGCHQLQNVLFRVDIHERIIMHRLFEVDGIEDFDAVAFLQKGVADVQNRSALRECFVKINKGKISPNFYQKFDDFTSSFISRFILSSSVSFALWLK